MSNKVRIAVISDIHFSQESEKDRRAFVITSEALKSALSNCEFDYLIVNGDVSYQGKEEGFTLAKDFFNELLDAKNNSDFKKEDIFFIPGNHDCERKKIISILNRKNGKYKKYVEKNKSGDLSVNRNDFLTFNRGLRQFERPFKNYIDFLRENDFNYYKNEYSIGWEKSDWLNYLCGYRKTRKHNITIICNNSSWYIDGEERGNLVLGTNIVQANLKKIKSSAKDNIIISCLHHQIGHLSWLESYYDKNNLSSNMKSLNDISDLTLTSDQHVPPQSPTYLEGKNLVISTGSVHDNLSFNNSFKIINLDLDSQSLTVEDYVSHNETGKYYFKQIESTYKKGKSKFELDNSFESRKFPLKLEIENYLDPKEDLFWINNNLKYNEIHGKGLRELSEVSNYLVNKYNKEFNVCLSELHDHKIKDLTAWISGKLVLFFMEFKFIFMRKKEIRDYNNILNKQGYSSVLVPYSFITTKNYIADYSNYETLMEHNGLVDKEFKEDNITIANFNLVSYQEIKGENNLYASKIIKKYTRDTELQYYA